VGLVNKPRKKSKTLTNSAHTLIVCAATADSPDRGPSAGTFLVLIKYVINDVRNGCVGHQKELADGPALRPDGPRFGQSTVVAQTVRACAESVRVPSFSRVCDLKPWD
jgi:hypothetical protein